MTAYDRLKVARDGGRPTGAAYVERIFNHRIEMHGDRCFGDDEAIIGGLGMLDDIAVTYIAIDRGSDMDARLRKSFGCPKPEGYRKAIRLMKQADKFHRPVVCFVDTQGAFPGADAEERGQSEAIAQSILTMMGLRVPVVTVVTGEGGSGGALALAAANRVFMLENAVYSVISPEGCASILWKDAGRVADAAEALHVTAEDMRSFKVADDVIPEDFTHFDEMCSRLGALIFRELHDMQKMSPEALCEERYARFRKFGYFDFA